MPKNFNFADEEPLIYERYACLPAACVLHGNLLRSWPVHTSLVLDALGTQLTQGAAHSRRIRVLPKINTLSSAWDCMQMGEQRQLSAQQHGLWGAVYHL